MDIGYVREELIKHLHELDQRSQLSIYGTDRQMNNIHFTIDTLLAEMINEIDELNDRIDNHASEVSGTELDNYEDRAENCSTVKHPYQSYADILRKRRYRYEPDKVNENYFNDSSSTRKYYACQHS